MPRRLATLNLSAHLFGEAASVGRTREHVSQPVEAPRFEPGVLAYIDQW